MDYTLMHKDIAVLDMQTDSAGLVVKVLDTGDLGHLPPGIPIIDGVPERRALNDWWTTRAIPTSRMGIYHALRRLHIASPTLLLEKAYGLSLSDHYWIHPFESETTLTWRRINFFDNDFSPEMGNVLFGAEPSEEPNLVSPDNTTEGFLRKKWIITDGQRTLMKSGSGVFQQEPFNELIASALMRRLGISHVAYRLTFDDGRPYALCENMVTTNTELVPALGILKTIKQPNQRGLFDHFLDCCEALGIRRARRSLYELLVVDYIIANENRHWGNFGLLRDPDTLEWHGPAPIWGSGTSLWYNTGRIGPSAGCKPFRTKHGDQVRLVEDFSWFDMESLDGFEQEIIEILGVSEDIDEPRRLAIAASTLKRARRIARLAAG
ncbi:MAG: hypothetical protein LBE83_01865 [Propionibacteriaceae bacterium]|jgi:hypothetical protein|nr:hypothetical protein [Propionibacteriaceae bacterium]